MGEVSIRLMPPLSLLYSSGYVVVFLNSDFIDRSRYGEEDMSVSAFVSAFVSASYVVWQAMDGNLYALRILTLAPAGGFATFVDLYVIRILM